MFRTFALVALLVGLAIAQVEGNYGDPMSAPEPADFLTTEGFCTASTCRIPGILPANPTERRLLAMFNFARTDPLWFKSETSLASDPNAADILKGAKSAPPLHSFYTVSITAHQQVLDIVEYSPRPYGGNPNLCADPSGADFNKCDWDAAFFAAQDPPQDPQSADQTCRPNLAPTSSMYDVCCLRLSSCTDSSQQHANRVVTNGFPWSSCGAYAGISDAKAGQNCGGQSGFLAANSGSELETIVTWLCDDNDNSGFCNVDCTGGAQCDNINDPTEPGAPGRANLIDPEYRVGGAGYAGCANCQYSNYWTFTSAFFAAAIFSPTYPIASAEFIPNGPTGNSGFMLSYWSEKASAFPVGGYVIVYHGTSASTMTALPMTQIAEGATYWVNYNTPAGCEEFFFAVVNDDKATQERTGKATARYPESGNLLIGSSCSDADGYTAVAGVDSCDDGNNGCDNGGVCVDSTTCLSFPSGASCDATTPCPKIKGGSAATIVVSVVMLVAALAMLL